MTATATANISRTNSVLFDWPLVRNPSFTDDGNLIVSRFGLVLETKASLEFLVHTRKVVIKFTTPLACEALHERVIQQSGFLTMSFYDNNPVKFKAIFPDLTDVLVSVRYVNLETYTLSLFNISQRGVK